MIHSSIKSCTASRLLRASISVQQRDAAAMAVFRQDLLGLRLFIWPAAECKDMVHLKRRDEPMWFHLQSQQMWKNCTHFSESITLYPLLDMQFAIWCSQCTFLKFHRSLRQRTGHTSENRLICPSCLHQQCGLYFKRGHQQVVCDRCVRTSTKNIRGGVERKCPLLCVLGLWKMAAYHKSE